MARTVWLAAEEKAAFALGQQAAEASLPRQPFPQCRTYNERAAFNDGWDTVIERRAPKRRPEAKRETKPLPRGW